MWNFLKYTVAVMMGTFFGIFLFIIVGGGIIVAVVAVALSQGNEQEVKDNTVLVVKLNETIREKAPNNPFKNFNFMSMTSDKTLGLNDILDNIRRASNDPKISCILLNVGIIKANYETVQEIRSALQEFKSSGKFIIAYSDYYTQSAYYLCSVADKVYMNPEGILELRGVSSQLIFFKNTLEKIGVAPQPIRHGKYKGAIEMFVNEKMSDANRDQHQVFVDEVWKQVCGEISASRMLDVAHLNKIADSLLVRNADDAVSHKLLDTLRYYDQIIGQIKDSLGIASDAKVPAIQLGEYISHNSLSDDENTSSPAKIAVVVAQGDIIPGQGTDDNIGGDRYAKLFRELREDATVKSVVFRLNTGGGSSLASESIWREVSLTAVVKPVVVSMGDYCASGGYYVACPATTVVANTLTLTGSIGVYGLLFDASKMLNNIGVSTDLVKTNAYADIGTVTRPLSSFEHLAIQKEVDNTYQKFISHVAKGRNLSISFVDSIGQGRIWAGSHALRHGLVDTIGGLHLSVDIAAEKASLGSNYDLVYYPRTQSPFEEIIKGFSTKMKESAIDEYAGEYKEYLDAFKHMNSYQGVQMKMPYIIKIQ